MRIANCGEIKNTDSSGAGFEPCYFSQLATLEEQNFWFEARNRIIIWALAQWANADDRFLEIGCGTGFVLRAVSERFPKLNATGGELFPEALQFARTRVPTARFVSCDARQMSFHDEFNCIGAFDVLEHIDNDSLAIQSIYQSLKTGGLLLVTVPQHQWLWSQSDEKACHCRRYEPGQLEAKLSAAGFEIVRTTSFISLLLPLMSLSRLWQRFARPDFDLASELRVPKVLSSIFTVILNVEFSAIKYGINFPAGGSRFIVARRSEHAKDSSGSQV